MGAEKGVSAFPEGENFFKWVGTITGPVGTVIFIFKFLFIVYTMFVFFL